MIWRKMGKVKMGSVAAGVSIRIRKKQEWLLVKNDTFHDFFLFCAKTNILIFPCKCEVLIGQILSFLFTNICLIFTE